MNHPVHNKLSDSKLSYEEVINSVPYTVFMSNDFVDLCNFIASHKFKSGTDEFKIYVNLLNRKSKLARYLMALIFIHKTKLHSFEEVKLNFINSDFCQKFNVSFPVNDVVHYATLQFIDKSYKKNIIKKFVLHNFYRALRGRKLREVCVRSYVDVSEKLFKHEYEAGASIVLFPFAMGIKRQIRFYKGIKLKFKEQVSFDGIPYGVGGLLRIILGFSYDKQVVLYELKSYEKYAKKLIRSNVKTLFGTDEFEPGSVQLHSTLKRNNIRSINYAHGVNQTCPYVDYEQFNILTSPQFEFYKHWNPQVKYQYQKIQFRYKKKINLPFQILFMESNFVGRFAYEETLQKRIILFLKKRLELAGMNLIVKLHPNSPEKTLNWYRNNGVMFVKEFNYEKFRCAFFTFFSTSFFTFLDKGPFYLFTDSTMDISLIIGREAQIFNIENDKEKIDALIKNLKNEDFFNKSHSWMIKQINTR